MAAQCRFPSPHSPRFKLSFANHGMWLQAVGAKDWLVDSTCSNLRAHLLNALGTERPAEDVGQDALADVRRQALEVLDNATTDTDGGPSGCGAL